VGTACRIVSVVGLCTLVQTGAVAAPACKGANKNDPGCPGAVVEAAPGTSVSSATVDWYNQKVVVRGTTLDTVVAFTLGGSGTLTTAGVTATAVDLPFDPTVAGEVTEAGNYALSVDGAVALSVYFKSQVVDPGATGCPCGTDWATELGGLWGTPTSDCLQITGGGSNDPADISGTVLTDPNDPAVYPHFPIGAAFYPGDPVNSVCRLVQVNGDATVSELVNFRINENQQAECATLLQANVCATTAP